MSAMQDLWTNDHREWYRSVYLQSEHWRELRGRKLQINPICQHCRSVKACDVHHVRYRKIFNVGVGDLLSLCRPCHDAEHATNGMPRRKRPRPAKFKLSALQRAHNGALRPTKLQRKQNRKAAAIARKGPEMSKDEQADVLRFQRDRQIQVA